MVLPTTMLTGPTLDITNMGLLSNINQGISRVNRLGTAVAAFRQLAV